MQDAKEEPQADAYRPGRHGCLPKPSLYPRVTPSNSTPTSIGASKAAPGGSTMWQGGGGGGGEGGAGAAQAVLNRCLSLAKPSSQAERGRRTRTRHGSKSSLRLPKEDASKTKPTNHVLRACGVYTPLGHGYSGASSGPSHPCCEAVSLLSHAPPGPRAHVRLRVIRNPPWVGSAPTRSHETVESGPPSRSTQKLSAMWRGRHARAPTTPRR